MPYEDSYEREEKDLNLHIAKMVEHMEFENELPEAEKHKRRLIRSIQGLPRSAEVAESAKMPWVLFGQLERMCFHAERILGKDWQEQARQQRRKFFDEDEIELNDDLWIVEQDDFENWDEDDEEDDQDFDRNYDPNENL